jgi:hypothetical protein
MPGKSVGCAAMLHPMSRQEMEIDFHGLIAKRTDFLFLKPALPTQEKPFSFLLSGAS